MTYRFRLLDENGDDLGPLVSRRRLWSVGEQLSRWHGDQLRIINVIPAEDSDDFVAYLVLRGEQPTPPGGSDTKAPLSLQDASVRPQENRSSHADNSEGKHPPALS